MQFNYLKGLNYKYMIDCYIPWLESETLLVHLILWVVSSDFILINGST